MKGAVRKNTIGNLNHIRANPAVFGYFDEYPADAQLCCASLSWAIGINFETRADALRARPRCRCPPKDEEGQRLISTVAPKALYERFAADQTNRKWIADFTYVWTAEPTAEHTDLKWRTASVDLLGARRPGMLDNVS